MTNRWLHYQGNSGKVLPEHDLPHHVLGRLLYCILPLGTLHSTERPFPESVTGECMNFNNCRVLNRLLRGFSGRPQLLFIALVELEVVFTEYCCLPLILASSELSINISNFTEGCPHHQTATNLRTLSLTSALHDVEILGSH